MAAKQPVPCPVRLGNVRSGGEAAQLHRFTLESNLHKMESLLKKGVDVDCANHLGQTPLFCASLLGLASAVELLLRYGADPNHRCADMSTPVHAAVFSCNPWLLSGLLDAGGDLRLHDDAGRAPQDWAEAGAQEHSPRMLSFLRSCSSHMSSLSQQTWLSSMGQVGPHSCKCLLRSPSFLELLRHGGSDLHANRKLSSKLSACDTVQCFGFGKLYVDWLKRLMGLLACMPLILDSDLGQAEDEPSHSYACGSFIIMTNRSWKGCRVTVKELRCDEMMRSGSYKGYLDQLVTEQQYCCQLFHPHLLQLLAMSVSDDPRHMRLVFERVHVGSLHSLLHHRRDEFLVLHTGALLLVLLHVCEALMYLHSRGLVLRGLSSHTVQIVHPIVAKVTGLGFMVPSEGGGPQTHFHPPLPWDLYNWAAPEALRLRACRDKADLYSLCALIQEFYTDEVPWGLVEPSWIRQVVESGGALTPSTSVPQPYYELVRSGLQPRAQDRTCNLQDLRYLLQRDLRELSQGRKRSEACWETVAMGAANWGSEVMEDRQQEPTALQSVQDHGNIAANRAEKKASDRLANSKPDRDIQHQLFELDQLLEEAYGGLKSGWALEERSEEGWDLDSTSLDSTMSFRHPLPLDDWQLSLRCPPDPESSEETSSYDDVVPYGGGNLGILPEQPPSKISQYIGSIVLNQKISQVLIQQIKESLSCVGMEQRGGLAPPPAQLDGVCSGQLTDCGTDEVDGTGAGPVCRGTGTRPIGHPYPVRSEINVSKAVGPPSRYYPRSIGLLLASHRAEHVTAQGEPHFKGQKENHDRPCHSSDDEELTYYHSAQEDSSDEEDPSNVEAPSHPQDGTKGESPGMTVRSDWQTDDSQNHTTTCRPGLEDRRKVFSGGMKFRKADPTSEARWTDEVSEVVTSVTQGHLGRAATSGSSESEGAGVCQPVRRQEPLGEHDCGRLCPQSCHSSDLELLAKSFSGTRIKSEETNFHMGQTFSELSTDSAQEEPTESESTGSPVEQPSVFLTPNPDLPCLRAQRLSQSVSSEEDLEVTEEVNLPAVSRPEGTVVTSLHGDHASTCPVEKLDETNLNSSVLTAFPGPSSLPDPAELAELSSIICSPSQYQKWTSKSQQFTAFGRYGPPCISTPCSPGSQSRLVGCHEELVVHMEITSRLGSTSSPPNETFDTACPGIASTLSTQADTSNTSRLQEFTTADLGEISPGEALCSQEDPVAVGEDSKCQGKPPSLDSSVSEQGNALNLSSTSKETTGSSAEEAPESASPDKAVSAEDGAEAEPTEDGSVTERTERMQSTLDKELLALQPADMVTAGLPDLELTVRNERCSEKQPKPEYNEETGSIASLVPLTGLA